METCRFDGVSTAVCMHQILLEDGAKQSREAQCCLNPVMMELVQKKIIKFLDGQVIYSISDSKWISPIHVVLKKGGIMVEENTKGELVPKRMQTD